MGGGGWVGASRKGGGSPKLDLHRELIRGGGGGLKKVRGALLLDKEKIRCCSFLGIEGLKEI